MATRTITTVTDDLDGSPDARTVTFSLEGSAYSIDLAEANVTKLNEALAPFIANAVRENKAPGRSKAAQTWRREDLQAWAKDNGHKVSGRGRVPQPILDEYLASR